MTTTTKTFKFVIPNRTESTNYSNTITPQVVVDHVTWGGHVAQ